eukprot:TRINITY_DN3828_c0_g1_i5.p1 TRINITY_DN3828_c0_g1~~TRINITY_DN3828_c0_g1_i5.p1  ORF type:complete len:788 (+),score=107.93 TRINITY_DN3828_c0_g1_i5:149-2512(+)
MSQAPHKPTAPASRVRRQTVGKSAPKRTSLVKIKEDDTSKDSESQDVQKVDEELLLQKDVNHQVKQTYPSLIDTGSVSEWARNVRNMLQLRADESRQKDLLDLETLKELVADEELIIEKESLRMLGIAAITNPNERKRLKRMERLEFMKLEKGLFDNIKTSRHNIAEGFVTRSIERMHSLNSSFQGGPLMITKFGGLLCQSSKRTLLERKRNTSFGLHREASALGAAVSSNFARTFNRKLILSPVDMSSRLSLSSSDLAISHTDPPSTQPLWGMVKASDGPMQLHRTERALLRNMITEALNDVPSSSISASIKLLARLLDAMYPPSILHSKVLANPMMARQLVQTKIDQLGYSHSFGHFQGIQDEINLKTAIAEVLAQMENRLKSFQRCYYEVTLHYIDKAVIGWTSNPLSLCEYPGSDLSSYGFCTDGTILYDGISMNYCRPWRGDSVVGVLADFSEGCIGLCLNGEYMGDGFGAKSPFRSEIAQRQKAAITSEHMIPCFGILGLEIPEALVKKSISEKADLSSHIYNLTGLADEIQKKRKHTPQSLTINFGASQFKFKPRDCVSCDTIMRATYHSTSSFSAIDDVDSAFEFDLDSYLKNQAREEFITSVEDPEPESWSAFPPSTRYIQTLSAIKIQTAYRRHRFVRCVKQAGLRRRAAIVTMQRFVRKYMPQRKLLLQAKATIIQRLWRGYRSRKVMELCWQYDTTQEQLERATRQIQRWWRRRQKTGETHSLAQIVRLHILRLNVLARRIQKAFRAFHVKQKNKRILNATKLIQRVWRGWCERI